MRAYVPWTPEEEGRLLRLRYKEGHSINQIAKALDRQPGAITSRLGKLADKVQLDVLAAHPLGQVLKGLHPVTGHVLKPDSIWRHPAILADIPVILKAMAAPYSCNEDEVIED